LPLALIKLAESAYIPRTLCKALCYWEAVLYVNLARLTESLMSVGLARGGTNAAAELLVTD